MTESNDNYRAPADVWARLAAPLPPNSIEWRQDGKPINRDGKFLARFVAYVEAGTVRSRLDSVVPGEWDLTISPFGEMVRDVQHEGSETVYYVKARLQVLGVVREDIGEGTTLKGASTDAFKRASVRFGIGHELYATEMLWIELDGDGKYAKPLEDPQKAYERKNGGGPVRVQGDATGVERIAGATSQPAPSAPPRALDEEQCPKCGGRMFDNRLTKRNPKAPDFKCRDRSCDGVIWPEKKVTREQIESDGAPGFDEVPAAAYDNDFPFSP